MQILIAILVLLFGIALVVVAVVYQLLDKYRFYCRRQWPDLEPIINEWISSASEQSAEKPGFGEAMEEYRAAKKPEKRINAFMRLAAVCPPNEQLSDAARRLENSAGRYNEYVRVYNKRFDIAPFGKVGALLGFCRLQSIHFD